MEGSDLDFQLDPDSDVKVAPDPASGSKASKPKAGSPDQPDSGARIVPLDKPSDSDVKMVATGSEEIPVGDQSAKTPSDSDIRIEPAAGSAGRRVEIVTEEIDLDAEAQRAEAAKPKRPTGKPRPSGLPTSSPFELSEPDVNLSGPSASKPATPPAWAS
jgi:hypothetical protein